MKNHKLFFCIYSITVVLIISSCKKDDDPCSKYKNSSLSNKYVNGAFVSNQGSFGTPNGSVSFINKISGRAENGIFEAANCLPLGDVVQSLAINNGKAYVVVNNSNKIEVVNADNFKSITTISGFALPRYFVALNNQKGYVTEWIQTFPNPTINGRVSVLDLNTNRVIKTISVGMAPEEMVILNNKLYVANSSDSIVTVVNTNADTVENNIIVGDAPTSLVKDKNNNIWVLAEGKWKTDFTGLDKSGALVKFNPANPTDQIRLSFNNLYSQPYNLHINGTGDKLFYIFDSKLYVQDINAGTLSSSPLINRRFDNFGVDPNDSFIYATKWNSSNNGYVLRYNASAVLLDSFQVGIFPSEIYFR